MGENLEVVTVEAVQTVRSAKPHKPLIVLHKGSSVGFRRPFDGVEAREADVGPIDDGQPNRSRLDARLWDCALSESAIVGASIRDHAGQQAQI